MGFSGSRFNFPAACTRDFYIISPMTVLSLVYLNPPSFERLSIIIFAVMIKEELIKNTVGLYINCIANKNLKWHKNNMNILKRQ